VTWNLEKLRATYAVNGWQVELNPTDPAAGLDLRHHGKACGTLLRVIPLPSHARCIQEAYVRESDLIVRYEQDGNDLYSFQLNWRAFDSGLSDALGLEMWLSIQTSLLDTYPTVDIRSLTSGGPWTTLTLRDVHQSEEDWTAGIVSRCADQSTLIMVQASDAQQADLQPCQSPLENSLRMFGSFMEKGVIRRARLCLVATPHELQQTEIEQAYAQFSACPLPLTA
jgi:hypothetical protein